MTAQESAQRVLVLVPWLLARPGATLAEAARVVGTTPEVVRRELEWLCYCGGPGLGGGAMFEVDIVGDRVTIDMAPGLADPLALTPAEATRLLLTLSSVADVAGDRLLALGTALDKIRAATGLDETVVTAIMEDDSRLHQLRDAIATGTAIALEYRGRMDEQPQRRNVDPWQVEFTSDGWYLHGHDHDRDAHRVFRVDRIEALTPTEHKVATPPPADLPSPVWTPTGDTVDVHLALRGGARWIGDQVATSSDRDANGVREITFATDSLAWAEDLVAAGGPDVEVIAPAWLRLQLARRAGHGLAVQRELRAQLDGDVG